MEESTKKDRPVIRETRQEFVKFWKRYREMQEPKVILNQAKFEELQNALDPIEKKEKTNEKK